MQKNNLCPLPNKVLVYEEIDTISQSIFNSKVPNKKILIKINQFAKEIIFLLKIIISLEI